MKLSSIPFFTFAGLLSITLSSWPIFAASTSGTKIGRALFSKAQKADKAVRGFARCGPALGSPKLRAFEDSRLIDSLQEAERRYMKVVGTKDPVWGNKAIYNLAILYDDLQNQIFEQGRSFRGLELSSPFSFPLSIDDKHIIASDEILQAAKEIEVLLEHIAAELDTSDPESKISAELKSRSSKLSQKQKHLTFQIDHPWHEDIVPGIIRSAGGQYFIYTDRNNWQRIKSEDVEQKLRAALKTGVDDIRGAFALVALSQSGKSVAPELIIEAIEHPLLKVRLAGFVAVQFSPKKEFHKPLLTAWKEIKKGNLRNNLFDSLQTSLFGEQERILLALKALVAKERGLANSVSGTRTLPLQERAWLIADLADTRLMRRYHQFRVEKNPIVAALGIYALYQTAGKKALYLAKKHARDKRHIVRCVAKHILEIDKERRRKEAIYGS